MTGRRHHDAPPTNGTAAKIAGLDRDVERTRESISELWARIDTFGRANWPLLLAGFGAAAILGSAVWGFTILPIHSEQMRTRNEIVDIRREHVRKDVDEARRAEMEAKFKNVEQQLFYLTNGLADARKDFREIAPPAKLLDQLLQRIERLEGDLLLESRRTPRAP